MNPFEALAEAQVAKVVRRKEAAVEKRRATMAAKAVQRLEEREALGRSYKAETKRAREKVYAENRHGFDLYHLERTLADFGVNDAKAIVEHVRSLGWLEDADGEARFCAVRIVGERVAQIITDMGKDPLDDPLPPRTNAFFACRTHIMEAGR